MKIAHVKPDRTLDIYIVIISPQKFKSTLLLFPPTLCYTIFVEKKEFHVYDSLTKHLIMLAG